MGVPNPWRVARAAAGSARPGVERGGAAALRGGVRLPRQGTGGVGPRGVGHVLSGVTEAGCSVLRGVTDRARGRGRVLPGVTR